MASQNQVTVNQQELCQIFGVTPQSIRAWQRQGCPVVQMGKRGQAATYRPADVIAWREKQARLAAGGDLGSMDLNEARRRKLAAEAASAELYLAKEQGKLVEVDIALDEIGRGLDATRSRLLSLSSRLAPLVAVEDDTARCKALIGQAISDALTELATGVE